MAGVTGQIKLSDRVALTGIYNYPNAAKFNFDAASGSNTRIWWILLMVLV
jgi:hypothetical protein